MKFVLFMKLILLITFMKQKTTTDAMKAKIFEDQNHYLDSICCGQGDWD